MRTKYRWTAEQLEPIVADKLPEPLLFDRVEPAVEAELACQAAWPPGPPLTGLDSVAYIHREKRRLSALVLNARGEAARFEADTRASHLAWKEQRGCWVRQDSRLALSITFPEGASHFATNGDELVEWPAHEPVRSFVQAQHF